MRPSATGSGQLPVSQGEEMKKSGGNEFDSVDLENQSTVSSSCEENHTRDIMKEQIDCRKQEPAKMNELDEKPRQRGWRWYCKVIIITIFVLLALAALASFLSYIYIIYHATGM